MSINNLESPSDSPGVGGNIGSKITAQLSTGFLGLKKLSDQIAANFAKIEKSTAKLLKEQAAIVKGNLGLGGRSGATNSVADGLGKMGNFSTQAKFGIGAGLAVAGGGALMYGMMPNTAAAVTQRMGLNSLLTGPGGMGPNSILSGLNKSLAGGTTGVGSPTQAGMALTYQAGMLATTPYNMKTIMPQMAGLSAMTGGTNQQMAGAMGSINSMRFMRSGTQTRDSKGRLLPINQIINNLFRSMYGGQKITAEQAALIYNPGSPSHKTVMDAAGGDPNLFAVLAEGIRTRAMANKDLTAKQMSSADKILDIRGVPKDDPMRANFRNNFAQNKLLGATQQGLVSGYDTAVNANASLTSGFADLAKELGPVTEGLAKLKGVLQTLPGVGGVLGGLTGMASNVGSAALTYKMLGGSFKSLPGASALGGVFGKGPSVMGPLTQAQSIAAATKAANMKLAGKFGVAGLATMGATYGLDKAFGKHVSPTFRKVGQTAATMGSYALAGAGLGAMLGGGIGSIPMAGVGALGGLAAYGVSRLFGQGGGDDCGHGNMPHKCNGGIGGDNSSSSGTTPSKGSAKTLQMPVPPGTKVTSPFGPRPGASAGISKNHTGIDYGVAVGTNIVAAADGVVTETGLHRQYGQYIIIKHGSKSTLYAHLSKIMARSGQSVVAGQVIALSGGKKGAFGAGTSTGPHLHFEVRSNGGVGAQGRVNPKGLFGKTFNFIKNVVTKAFNFVKQTSNKYLGTNLSWKDSAGSGINLNSKKDLSSISSGSLSTLISNSLSSGSPLDINTIRANAGNEIDGSSSYTAVDTSGGKKKKVVGTVNNKEDLVSGDKVGMVGGSRPGLIKMLYDGGFRGKGLSTAFSVALAESGGRAKAKNFKGRDLSYGLFQINMTDDDPKSPNMGRNRRKQFDIAKNEALYDPMTNIRAAYEVSNKGSWWKQWSTFNDGKYTKYLDDASRAAVKAKLPTYHTGSYNVPKVGVGGGDSSEHMAMVQAGEMILPAKLAEKVRNGTGYTPGTTNIKVDMKVNIARSSMQEAEYMFTYFKEKLEKELKNNAIGTY